ncbi:MAG: hypothetical protein FJ088_13365, partial [Deltaproteobacteria bacterium]|nr:hypothetical protein [Deltaproteobacteria bacterium]
GAKKDLEGAVKVCPAYAEPYFYIGMILDHEGDSKGAAQMFSKCGELAGDLQIGARCKKLSGE